MAKKKKAAEEEPVCLLKQLPEEQWIEAALVAVEQNPMNAPAMLASFDGAPLEPARLAVMVSKYWGTGGVDLTVGFPFDSPSQALRTKVMSHMNAWGKTANVRFRETNTSPQVRIAFTPGQGHYSYLGTDVLLIGRNEPTMNLEMTERTAEKEFYRVVRHETGHTLGMPHEHLRRELVARIDPEKAIAYFRQHYGWSAAMTRSNVLTPIEETSLMGTLAADQTSIMAYQLVGAIMKDGKPILGGSDINQTDADFCARIYPSATPPPPPPPPPEGILPSVLIAMDAAGKEVARYKLQAALSV